MRLIRMRYALPPAKIKSKKKTGSFIILSSKWKESSRDESTDGKDIWTGLYEFPMIETQDSSKPSIRKIKRIGRSNTNRQSILSNKQILSHQIIYSFFYLAKKRIRKKKNGVSNV